MNYGVIQGFPVLRKAVTTHVKEYDIFSRLLDIAFGATPSGWWMNGEVFTILNPRSFVGFFSGYGS